MPGLVQRKKLNSTTDNQYSLQEIHFQIQLVNKKYFIIYYLFPIIDEIYLPMKQLHIKIKEKKHTSLILTNAFIH